MSQKGSLPAFCNFTIKKRLWKSGCSVFNKAHYINIETTKFTYRGKFIASKFLINWKENSLKVVIQKNVDQ